MATDRHQRLLADADALVETARELRDSARYARARASEMRTQARAFTAMRRAKPPQPAASPEDDHGATPPAAVRTRKTTAYDG